MKVRRADLLFWLYCIGIAALKFGHALGQTLRVETRIPAAWAHLYSAQQLLDGHWLGSVGNLALLAKPGYSFWVAFNYLIGMPIGLATTLLLILSAFIFLLALRRLPISRPFGALLFTLILLDPVALSLYRGASAATLTFPLILLTASFYFLSIYREDGRRKWGLWLLSGAGLAAIWISVPSPWLPLAMVTTMLLWELSMQPPGHSWKAKLRWVFPLILAFFLPAAVADLSVRALNQAEYGKFILQQKPYRGRIPSIPMKGLPPPEELFRKVGRNPGDNPQLHYLEIIGWAASRESRVKKIELLDEEGRVIGETQKSLERPDVRHYLKETVQWQDPKAETGFLLESKIGVPPFEKLRLAFLAEGGSRVLIPLENLGNIGPDFHYHLDSIQTKLPGQNFRESLRSSLKLWHGRILALLLVASVLAGILVVGSKLAGEGPKAADFWLLLFSILILFFLVEASRGDWRDYSLLRPRAWPLATLVCYQAILLLHQVACSSRLKFAESSTILAWLKSGPVERFFLFFALGFGVFFVFSNPPFQAPDETAHSFRAFQTSQAQSAQAPVPTSVVMVANRFLKVTFQVGTKIFPREIWEALEIPLQPEHKTYYGSIGVSFIPYLPQAAGFAIGRVLRLPPLAILYLGRLCNLLAWAALVFFAIRRLPFFKWVFFFLALSPMSIYEASSISHDPITNGTTYLLIATFLSYAFGAGERISNRQILGMLILGALASLAKAVYFPLVFLYFWIPVRKMGSRIRYFLVFVALFAFSAGTDLLWNMRTGAVKKFSVSLPTPVHGEISFILGQPWEFLKLIGRTLQAYSAAYLESFIGKLGWLDTDLPTGMLFFYGISLVLIARYDSVPGIRFSLWQKALSMLVFLSVCGLLFVIFFLTWTAFGASRIEGIQGRYLIPIAPLFLLIFYNNRRKARQSLPLVSWVPMAAAVVLLMTGAVLLNRFFYF